MSVGMKRLLIVGLDPPALDALREHLDGPMICHPDLPQLQLRDGVLFAESASQPGAMRRVDAVVFHGIFDVSKDFDFITALALWRGPCLPSASGLLDCRLRAPALARALRVSAFATPPRSFAFAGDRYHSSTDAVAKWGHWHCGENKHRFEGDWTPEESAIIEPFITGDAVRITVIGEQSWQVQLRGEGWLKSLHHPDAHLMPVDPNLDADARRLAAHFGLELAGVDYIIDEAGDPHLLEVNHIPNVTRFQPIRTAYLERVRRFVRENAW